MTDESAPRRKVTQKEKQPTVDNSTKVEPLIPNLDRKRPKRPKIRLTESPCKTPDVHQFFAKHPDDTYCSGEVAKHLGVKNVQQVTRILSRMATSGDLERRSRGFYRLSRGEKVSSLDQFLGSANVGIENLIYVKRFGHGGDAPPQSVIDPKVHSVTIGQEDDDAVTDVIGHFGQHSVNIRSKGSDAPTQKEGFPWLMPTGQVIQWWLYQNGTEVVVLAAKGKPSFSLDLILYIIECLVAEGIGDGEGWFMTSMEVNADSKRYRVSAPVQFQASRDRIIKLYQHRAAARLEEVVIGSFTVEESLLMITDAYERSEGRKALRKVTKLEKTVQVVHLQLAEDNRKLHNYFTSLSNTVHAGQGRKKRGGERPKEQAPLVTEAPSSEPPPKFMKASELKAVEGKEE